MRTSSRVKRNRLYHDSLVTLQFGVDFAKVKNVCFHRKGWLSALYNTSAAATTQEFETLPGVDVPLQPPRLLLAGGKAEKDGCLKEISVAPQLAPCTRKPQLGHPLLPCG